MAGLDDRTDVMVKLPPRVEQPRPDRVYEEVQRDVRSDEVGYNSPAPRLANAPSEKMLKLIHELIKERDPAGLEPEIALAYDRFLKVNNCSYVWARRLIGGLLKCERFPVKYASRGQVNYIRILCDRLGQPPQVRMEYLSHDDADAEITRLKAAVDRGDGRTCVPDGIYVMDDKVYKVMVALHTHGRVVAKRMQKLDEPIEQRDGKVRLYSFEPVSGVLGRLTESMRLTEEKAREFGRLYGCCVRCGITLTKEESIDRAMGPVCWKKMFG